MTRAPAGGLAPLSVVVVAACPFPERRGTPVRVQRLSEALQRRGHDVSVVTYPHGGGALDAPLVVHRVRSGGTRHRSEPGPTMAKLLVLDPLLALLLRRLLRGREPDVIHAHHYEGLLVASAARLRLRAPLVYDAHMLLESELPSYGRWVPRGVKRAVGTALDRWLPGRADHVISVTDAIRDSLLAGTRLRDDQVTTVSNGVEVELFESVRAAEAPDRAPVVVFTGNLAPYQGVDLLLRAFVEVLAEMPTARLRIVTESSFADYEPLARSLGVRGAVDVIATGFADVPRLLAESDVAANPRQDCHGVPLKLLNYMAAARPVVSFREAAPGVEHGRTGWLVEKGDLGGFAAGILALLRDRPMARAMGAAARDHVRSHHSWDAAAEATEQVYRRVLRRSAAGRPLRTGAADRAATADAASPLPEGR